MLPLAEQTISEKFQKRMRAVAAQINGAGVSQAVLRKHQFDPVKAFGGEENVLALLDGRREGTAAMWVNERTLRAKGGSHAE
jgi:hypothetical protein